MRREAFERCKADAVTVSPYLGLETLQPFIDHTDKGIFVLCRTSNPQAEWMQAHPENDPTYLRVAREVVKANLHGNLMLVAGATHVDELAQIRNAVGSMPLLVPGIGAQGGNLEEVVRVGAYEGGGLVINVSRSVAYAGAGKDFASGGNPCARAPQSRDTRTPISRGEALPRPHPATLRVAHHPEALPRPHPATLRVAHHPEALPRPHPATLRVAHHPEALPRPSMPCLDPAALRRMTAGEACLAPTGHARSGTPPQHH